MLGIVLALTVPSLALAEGLTVGAASTFSLGSATLALGCGDLDVSGTFNANTGSVEGARDVNIAGGGALNGGSGTLDVARNWSNSGSFSAGTSAIRAAWGGRGDSAG